MDFINRGNQAVEGYVGSDPSSEYHNNKSKSTFTKAIDSAEKYNNNAIEYDQDQVAKREQEKYQPSYVDKHKSVVGKDAAEDFLANQRVFNSKANNNNFSSPHSHSNDGTEGYSRFPDNSRNGPNSIHRNNAGGSSYSSHVGDAAFTPVALVRASAILTTRAVITIRAFRA